MCVWSCVWMYSQMSAWVDERKKMRKCASAHERMDEKEMRMSGRMSV